jgi:hypothetical protein
MKRHRSSGAAGQFDYRGQPKLVSECIDGENRLDREQVSGLMPPPSGIGYLNFKRGVLESSRNT